MIIYHAMSLLIGWVVMALNFWVVSKSWGWVLKKKSIALAGTIIVLKYPLLFFVLMFILKHKRINAPLFVVGLATFPFASLIYKKVIQSKTKK